MQKIKQFKIIISKFTSKYIQLIFTFEKNKLLLQSFNYTFYRYEKSFYFYFIYNMSYFFLLYFTFVFFFFSFFPFKIFK